MAAAGKFRYAYLAFLSKPKADRQVYRIAKQTRVRSMVELGIESIPRTLNLISVCQRYSPGAKIRYTGFDAFDERTADQSSLTLIDAHRQLKASGAEPRLMPGGATAAFSAMANSLLGTDLVLISAGCDDEHLSSVWFYLPRILADNAVVLRGRPSDDDQGEWDKLSRDEINRMAESCRAAQAA